MAGPPASSQLQRERTPAGSVLTRSPSRSRSGSPDHTSHSHSQGPFAPAPRRPNHAGNTTATDRNSNLTQSSSGSSSARNSRAGANAGRSSGSGGGKGGIQRTTPLGVGTGAQASSRRASAPASQTGGSFSFPSGSSHSASNLGTPSPLIGPTQNSLLPHTASSAFQHPFLKSSSSLASLPRRPSSFSSVFFPGTSQPSHSHAHTQRTPARSSSIASFPFLWTSSLGPLGTPSPPAWGGGLNSSGRKNARSLCGASCLISTVLLLLCTSFLTPFALQYTPALSLDLGSGLGLTQGSAQRVARFVRSGNRNKYTQGAFSLPWQYGIIIDAGSSGTRIHVFPYRFPVRRGQAGVMQAGTGQGEQSEGNAGEERDSGLRAGLSGRTESGSDSGDSDSTGSGTGDAQEESLLPEFQPSHPTMKVRPGLSFYRDDPASAAQSLLPLLHFAKTKVCADASAE